MIWLRRALLIAGGWAALALLFALRQYLSALLNAHPMPFLRAARYPFADHAFWAAVTAPIIVYTLWLHRAHVSRLGAIGAQVAGFLVVYALCAAYWVAMRPLFGVLGPLTPRLIMTLAAEQLYSAVWMYGAIVGLTLVFEARVRASELRASLAEAELRSLKLQLQPHFLFNTLHSVSALVHENPDAADDMLADLGALLRISLDSRETQEVPVDDELQALDLYMRIQQMRFQGWLTLRLEVAPEVHRALMPHMMLQPLAENSIRHGIARRAAPGTLQVAISRRGSLLRILVRDDGPGALAAAHVRDGVGLSNTRARLQKLYGASCSMDVHSSEAGFSVEIQLPFRAAALEAA